MSNYQHIISKDSRIVLSLHKATMKKDEIAVLELLCEKKLGKKEFVSLIRESRNYEEDGSFWDAEDRSEKIYDIVFRMRNPVFVLNEDYVGEMMDYNVSWADIDGYDFEEGYHISNHYITYKNHLNCDIKIVTQRESLGWQPGLTFYLNDYCPFWTPVPGLYLTKNRGFIILSKIIQGNVVENNEIWKLKGVYDTYFDCLEYCEEKNKGYKDFSEQLLKFVPLNDTGYSLKYIFTEKEKDK